MVKHDQSEPSSASWKYALCSDVLPTLPSNLRPMPCINYTMWTRRWRYFEKGHRVDAFHCVFCGLPRVQVCDKQCAQAVRHVTPLPHPAQGRRRTCWREMCWLKSIEVEDQKIISRKVSHYFGIYQSTFVFVLNSRFLCHTLKIFLFFDNLT